MHRKSHYLSQINLTQVLTKQICEKDDNISYCDFHIYLVRWAKSQRPVGSIIFLELTVIQNTNALFCWISASYSHTIAHLFPPLSWNHAYAYMILIQCIPLQITFLSYRTLLFLSFDNCVLKPRKVTSQSSTWKWNNIFFSFWCLMKTNIFL